MAISPSIFGYPRTPRSRSQIYEIEKLRAGLDEENLAGPRTGPCLAVSLAFQGSGDRRIISPCPRRRTSMAYLSTLPTAFERQVRKLGLDERTCVASKVLRLWCEENKDRYYIPEWLLARWGMTVNPSLGPEHNDSAA